MNVRLHVAIILIILALFATPGCNDSPGPLGIRLLPPGDSIRIATSVATATSDFTYLYPITGTSTTLLTGVSNGIEARTLLSYTGFSTIPAADALDSVTLDLSINYRFLDSTGSLAFEVRKMLVAVTPSTFRWDSSTVPGAYSDTVSGRFIRGISPGDSAISVRLDTTLIRDWISTNGGSFIFLPLGNIVAGFKNGANSIADYRPLLTVYYHDSTGTAATLSLRPAWGIFVANSDIPFAPDHVSLQAGVASRGIIRFDTISVPKFTSVTEAILQVAIDTTQSLTNNFTVEKIDVYLLRSTSPPYDSLVLGTTLTQTYDNGQKVYQGNVRFILQQWLLHETNRGIVLRATGEQTTVDRFVIFGSAASAALRPRISVTYTLLP